MKEAEIYSFRKLQFAVEKVYGAFSDPELLKHWWGPEGFTNTIHEFDLKPEGKWRLSMHGPDGARYENESVFKRVIPLKEIYWTRLSAPLFDMSVEFEAAGEKQSAIAFRMYFRTEEECERLKAFILPRNEENFDR